jgi:hypothetical protein
MGGMNHQPCGKCIRHATVLSKTFCLAHAAMLEANAVLEDGLIAELYASLDHAAHFFGQIDRHLERSIALLNETTEMTKTILGVMQHTPFQNVAELASMDMTKFRNELLKKQMISDEITIWASVSATIVTDGFEGIFAVFIEQFDVLRLLTDSLRQAVVAARASRTSSATIIDALEQNRFDLKTRFARLLTRWNRVALIFLYSSLISTETHLRSFGYASLEAVA